MLYLEIKNKSIPSSSLPAGNMAVLDPCFDGLASHVCVLWPGYGQECLLRTQSLYPSSDSPKSVIWMKKKERDKSNFSLCFCPDWTTSLLIKRCLWFQPVSIASLATTKAFIALVYFQRPKPMNIPSVLWSPTGPRMGLVRAQGKNLLYKTMGREFAWPSVCWFCLQDTQEVDWRFAAH